MKKKIYRFTALFTAINLLVEVFFPAVSYALTSGPSQPEHVQFAPVGANNTVDLFSGDFSYNIPLFELPGPDGGYPFNLTYQAGVGVEEEASWVGLGWNLTPGAINRQMRGLPDEFKGDEIVQKIDRKANRTLSFTQGVGATAALEFFGLEQDKIEKVKRAMVENGTGAPLSLNAGINLSMTISHNNYTGIGYSYSRGFSTGMNAVIGNLKNSQISLGINAGNQVSVDSESGVNTSNNAGANIGFNHTDKVREGDKTIVTSQLKASMGFNYGSQRNSRLGLLSEGYTLSSSFRTFNGIKKKGFGVGLSSNWSLNYSNNGYMPTINTPTIATNFSFLAKVGFATKGILGGSGHYSGTYARQDIRYDDKSNKLIQTPAYGYNHSDKTVAASAKGLMDINRERDKVIHKETKTLPAPNFTYDTYMVTGQGLTGMFRPYRGEVGVLSDSYTKSVTRGASGGVDISIPVTGDWHWGGNFEAVTGRSTSDGLSQIGRYRFRQKEKGKLHEPLYYKFQGEASIKPLNSLEKIGNHLPVQFELDEEGRPIKDKIVYAQVASELTREDASLEAVSAATGGDSEVTMTRDADIDPYFNAGRDSRNTLIQEVTNKEVGAYPEYQISYTDKNHINSDGEVIPKALDRKILNLEDKDKPKGEQSEGYKATKHIAPHHLAGFTCTNASGMRYVYGLPAYNHEQVEVVRSSKAAGDQSYHSKMGGFGSTALTEEFVSETTTPAYPYAYLLTSILGTDYIDVDYESAGGRGISENDLGYWVKFGYERVHNDYKWQSPYQAVNFTEGLRSSDVDDKASQAYGLKDIWYLEKAETKSHIAIFHTSDRADALAANGKEQKRLDKISLYTRHEYETKGLENGTPIKEIHFGYEYELCAGAPNADAGKLTLKKIWFTYQGVNRGQLNPYEFTYYDAAYAESAMDRWGVFDSRGSLPHKTHASFPYVLQDMNPSKRTDNVSAWNLKSIKMPTGSVMRIEYESDDYAYVQDKQAMQMYAFSTTDNPFSSSEKEFLDHNQRKLYFKLPTHDQEELDSYLASGGELTEEYKRNFAARYLDGRGQVYVKTVISLRRDEAGDPEKNGDYEDMSAYLDIESEGSGIEEQGGNYYGYVTLKPAQDTEGRNYHPLVVGAWTKLITEHGRLLNPDNKMGEIEEGVKWSDFGKILSTFKLMRERRGNYYEIAESEEWGKRIKVNYSYIRLNNTNGHKYGGGHRVKSVKFWDGTGTAFNESSTYGQVYEYTTTEDGKEISSGVASYEPLVGGDENALRYAEKYIKDVPGKSAMGLTGYEFYVEYPVNEGYYPGAKVGYSKVSVRSLATAEKMNLLENPNASSGLTNASTTGLTVNEFYTTKDFPTLAAQTPVDHQEKNIRSFTLFPVGAKTEQNAGMSQGFVVEVNNMNGQAKAMAHYGQNDKGEVLYDKPISSSEYVYKTVQRGKHRVLDNKCSVLVKEEDGLVKTKEMLVGVEYDMFIDHRRSKTKTTRIGTNFNLILVNLGVPPAPATIPTLFFSGTTSKEEVNITVINKVIYRSGILDYVKVSDGLSVSTTQNLLWDAKTGGVLLTSVNNNFDDKIYSYTIPAYTQYDQMGGAYRNIGLTFELSGLSAADGGRMYNMEAPMPKDLWTSELVTGDELAVALEGEEGLYRAIYMGTDREDQKMRFYFVGASTSGLVRQARFTVIRSGRRNLLSVSAGNITSLKDPTQAENRNTKVLSGTTTITERK